MISDRWPRRFVPASTATRVITATKTAIRILGRRVLALGDELAAIDGLLKPLVVATAPRLLEVHGVGVDTAATLLVAAGDNPNRLRSEAAWAYLCGTAPIPASSGKVTRWRLNRGGDRQANSALWVVVTTRASRTGPSHRIRTRGVEIGVEERPVEHPADDRPNPVERSDNDKAQVNDLGFHHCVGGGGGI